MRQLALANRVGRLRALTAVAGPLEILLQNRLTEAGNLGDDVQQGDDFAVVCS